MKVKTHLIIKEHWNEYEVKWVGRLIDSKPLLNENGLPTFSVVSSNGRIELTTFDMKHLVEIAKRNTYPKGRAAETIDKSYIYIKEEKGKEKLLGIITHRHIRKYAPMYDEV